MENCFHKLLTASLPALCCWKIPLLAGHSGKAIEGLRLRWGTGNCSRSSLIPLERDSCQLLVKHTPSLKCPTGHSRTTDPAEAGHVLDRMASKAATEAVKTAATRTQLRLIALPLCKKPELIYYYAHKRQIKGKQPESQEDSASDTDVEAVNEPERGQLASYLAKATSEQCLIRVVSELLTLKHELNQTRPQNSGRSWETPLKATGSIRSTYVNSSTMPVSWTDASHYR